MLTSKREFAYSYINQNELDIASLYRKVSIEDEKGIKLDKKKFIDEFKQLVNIRCFGESFMLYNHSSGITEELSDLDLERIVKFIADEINPKLWILNVSSVIKETLKREVDILQSLHRLIANNYVFSESNVINKTIKEYRDSQDPVLMFFKETIRYAEGNKIMKKDIIDRYMIWGSKNSIDTKGTDSTSKFWKEIRRVSILEDVEIKEVKSKGSRYIKNIDWAA